MLYRNCALDTLSEALWLLFCDQNTIVDGRTCGLARCWGLERATRYPGFARDVLDLCLYCSSLRHYFACLGGFACQVSFSPSLVHGGIACTLPLT